MNGKVCPTLMQVRPEWHEETLALTLRFPDGAAVGGVVELGEPVEPTLSPAHGMLAAVSRRPVRRGEGGWSG